MMERDPLEMQRKIEESVPVFAEIYKIHPNLFGSIPDYNDGSTLFLLTFLCLIILVAGVMLAAFHVAFLYQMQNIKKWVSAETFTLHKMLHRFVNPDSP